MDMTTRMTALLSDMRRERNGAVADAMRFYGTAYGLNYGVSLPTIRRLARAQIRDHAFARYLYAQGVRELRLSALHIADPGCVTEAEFGFWATGIVNSEIAEEAAFALLSRIESLPALFRVWISGEDPLLQYAALMAASRSTGLSAAYVEPTWELLRRNAGEMERLAPHLTAKGAVALLAAFGAQNEENRQAVIRAAGSLGTSPAEDYVHEEVAWMLEA